MRSGPLSGRGLLQVEQILLAPQAAAVAAEVAVLVDDAVAGNQDRDAVQAVGPADGAHGRGVADGRANS